MKKIVIMGNSLAGAKAAESLRQRDESSAITLLPLEDHWPYYPHRLADVVGNPALKSHIYYQPQSHYQKLNIHVRKDARVVKVSFKRKKISLLDQDALDYDELIITDTDAHVFPDIKGAHKAGAFAVRRFADIDHILKALTLAETVTVQSETPAGLKMACALRQNHKDILWVIATRQILPGFLDAETAFTIRQLVEETGIRIVEESALQDVLGDTDVKAVRLKSGKVFAGQMVIWGDAKPDFKIFKDSDLAFDERIHVDSDFRTNIAHVYAVGQACNGGGGWDDHAYLSTAERQGQSVARCILDEENNQEPALSLEQAGEELLSEPGVSASMSAFRIDKTTVHLLGTTSGLDQDHVYACRDSRGYKKIFIKDQRLSGAVLINAPADVATMLKLIESRDIIPEDILKNPSAAQIGSPAESEETSGDTRKIFSC